MRRLTALCAAMVLVLAACGGDGDEASDDELGTGGGAAQGAQPHDHAGNPTSTCEPSGTTVTISASGTKFDKDCLAAPASRAFTLEIDNKDPLPHNLAILESHTASDVLFRAEIFQGPNKRTFNVNALRPGTYAFHCEVHPQVMSGTFIVK